MVFEGVYSDTELVGFWRCVICGDYIDSVVWENRQFQRAAQGKNRKKGALIDRPSRRSSGATLATEAREPHE